MDQQEHQEKPKKKLHRLYKKKKKSGDHQTQEQYNNLKHHTQKITRQAYWKYFENVVKPDENEPRSGMKRLWTYIKNKRKDIVGISSLKMDGKLYCDPVTKSNILNRQFKSAFSEKTSYTTEEFLNSNRMNSTTTQHPNMKSFDITCNGITKLVRQLNPYKAPGPDNISPMILKELATDISPLLQLIFQKSLDTGVVPEDWRIANVSPVYKKGQNSLAENNRPISLTSVCCKTMEHILASKIVKHGEENNILYPLQHGFRKGHSCQTQFIEFVDDISKNLLGQQTDILILDFAKAFDKVNNRLLIHKLQHYGIIGKSVSGYKTGLQTENNL